MAYVDPPSSFIPADQIASIPTRTVKVGPDLVEQPYPWDVAWPGEHIKAPNGHYLGGFEDQYIVPADQIMFYASYPVGWTNCSWYEHQSCAVLRGFCSCADCIGHADGIQYVQRRPGDLIDPCYTASGLDHWGMALAPGICREGCSNCAQRQPCAFRPPGGRVRTGEYRCGYSCGGHLAAAGWPLVPFGVGNSSQTIRTVIDESGPIVDGAPELQTMKALEIDLSGDGAEGAAFVGKDGGYDTGRPPFFNSSDPPEGDKLNAFRSASGINYEPGDCWLLWFWVKTVPDWQGFNCGGGYFDGSVYGYDGYGFQAAIQRFGATASEMVVFSRCGDYHLSDTDTGMFPWEIYLTGGWELYYGWVIPLSDTPTVAGWTLNNAVVTLRTRQSNRMDANQVCGINYEAGGGGDQIFTNPVPNKLPRGRVHIKAPHLLRGYDCRCPSPPPIYYTGVGPSGPTGPHHTGPRNRGRVNVWRRH